MTPFETINPQNNNERRKMMEAFTPTPAEQNFDDDDDKEKPQEKLEVTSLAEGMAEGQQEIQKAKEKFGKWEEQLPKAKPEALKRFIEFAEKGAQEDPLLKKYPDFKNQYERLKSEALALLGEEGLHMVSQEINAARKKGFQAKTGDIGMAIEDLNGMLAAWESKLENPQTNEAEKQKIQRLMMDAKEMRDAQLN